MRAKAYPRGELDPVIGGSRERSDIREDPVTRVILLRAAPLTRLTQTVSEGGLKSGNLHQLGEGVAQSGVSGC